jgi:hypothetical protein
MGQAAHCLNRHTDEKTSVQDRQERAGSWGGYDLLTRAHIQAFLPVLGRSRDSQLAVMGRE